MTTMTAPSPASRFDTPAALLGITLPVAMTWAYLYGTQGTLTGILYSVSRIIEFVLPGIWIWVILKQPFKLMTPTRNGTGLGILFGLLVSAAMFVLYFGFLRDAPVFAETPQLLQTMLADFNITTLWAFLAFAAFITIFNSSLEEYFWRWFVFGRLNASKGVKTAVLLSSLGFALHHILILNMFIPPEFFWSATLVFSFLIAIGGAVWCWLTYKTGSVFAAWISHVIIDAAAMLIGLDMLLPVLS